MKFFNTFYGLLSLLFKLGLLLLIALIFYVSIPIKTMSTVTLPQGSVTKIIEHLKSEGYTLTVIDKYILVVLGQPKSGTLQIGEGSMNRIDFLLKLTNAKEAIDVITLIPGETRSIFLEELSKTYKLDIKKLESFYDEFSPYKEAGIIPDTYHLSKNINEENLIKILINQSEKRYEQLAIEAFKKYDKKEWLRILIIASVIQKEAANNEEMPVVASVIYNRLKIGMALQMDGTLNYGKYSHVKITPERIRTDKSGFNTYVNKGLPPYPVCSVSTEAIKAALNPKKTNHLYFMKNKDGVHDFTDSYQEHLENINRAR
ncbi:endolytic transglycosylase MltG [bacterium]|nr:endolytic transglycosylase MltG [bacterium]MBU1958453.1 endolytic transglycosylase MltG [bacterium]